MIALGENNAIALTRGDTATITLVILDASGEIYELEEGDEVVLTVKASSWAPEALLELTAEDMAFSFDSSATADLSPGTYYYDIRLKTASGESYTVVEKAEFIIAEAVTWS